jgi:hypothetical protein
LVGGVRFQVVDVGESPDIGLPVDAATLPEMTQSDQLPPIDGLAARA